MKANVILGVNIDTPKWINKLKKENCSNIIILDYDSAGEVNVKDGVLYIYENDIQILKKYDEIRYYKSLYVYPGFSGRMSQLFERD
ncbi:hypothetical protein [Planococcus sp. 107-1]|uniref:hypothetical protein n=1 Tax=Planococcus sp. 107-1 TaxID=2908840 RepID=UPI001F36D5CC|nr:hypothetical protein [Planococcus sp. 107-1]UJF26667.1 hypothetical protein L0M13_16250 [Planococcus sp. 107-1]